MMCSSDSEGMGFDDIEQVYRYFVKDPKWGIAVWCMIRRKQMPQKPVEMAIRVDGVWDLSKIQEEYGLESID